MMIGLFIIGWFMLSVVCGVGIGLAIKRNGN